MGISYSQILSSDSLTLQLIVNSNLAGYFKVQSSVKCIAKVFFLCLYQKWLKVSAKRIVPVLI